jgi:Domain of unknown function (DUF4178)
VELMPVPKVSGLNCPNCGAGIELRSFTNATSVVCQNCLSVLDARDPNLQVLQEAQSRQRIVPDIPLGSRGTFPGGTFEVIGFQERTVYADGVAYSWQEYLIFNPYKGFRYLTVYRGHWNFVRTLNTLPAASGPKGVRVGDTEFRIYSNSMAETTFVLGEFPWMVKVGEQVQVTDYIAPPKVLSAETTEEEIVWSVGDYMTGEEVWKAFNLTTPAPRAYGVFENQPAPASETVGSLWRASLIMAAAALLVAMLLYGVGSRKMVARQSFTIGNAGSASFDVPGHESNLELKTINETGQPMYVQYSLVKQGEAKAIRFGRQVRYGGPADVAYIGSISSGRYVLSAEADGPSGSTVGQYEVELRRDVPSLGWLFGALVFLLIPPILNSLRASSFERSRWAGSDF